MSYAIYDLSPVDPELFEGDVTALEVIESGLSSGELRQSLLDRMRQELAEEELYFLNYTLKDFEFQISEEFLETPSGQKSALEDIENVLYDLDDGDISDMIWWFSRETVYVAEEEA